MYSYYLLCFFLSLLFIILEKFNSSKIKWHYLVLFILIIMIMSNATDKFGDLSNYKASYNRTGEYNVRANVDIGYSAITFIANKVGLNFTQFKCIILIVSLTLIFRTLVLYTNYAGFFFFFYAVHSMFLDATQLRNFLSIAIVIYALRFLLKEDQSILLYVLLVLLASTIHIMAAVYLCFIWIRLNNTLKKWTLRVLPVVCLVIIYLSINTDLMSGIILFFSDFTSEGISEKLEHYASTRSRLGFLAPTIIYMLYVMFIMLINRKILKNYNTTVRKKECKNFVYTNKYKVIDNYNMLMLIEQINIVGLIFLPFNIVSLTFYRFVRNICLFDLIYFSICYDAAKSTKKRIIIFGGVCILIILWRYFDFHMYLDSDFIKEVYFYN